MSDDESYKCDMCYKTFIIDKHDYICNDCLEITITLWTCERCNNSWSPDYCNEEIYSDCCHAMMEGCNVDIGSIKYCNITCENVLYGEKSCETCLQDGTDCKNILKAYTYSKCKLKDYLGI